ncbi:hypothetical protein GOODEAATRI_031069, partial [Goodea atripinnis]
PHPLTVPIGAATFPPFWIVYPYQVFGPEVTPFGPHVVVPFLPYASLLQLVASKNISRLHPALLIWGAFVRSAEVAAATKLLNVTPALTPVEVLLESSDGFCEPKMSCSHCAVTGPKDRLF